MRTPFVWVFVSAACCFFQFVDPSADSMFVLSNRLRHHAVCAGIVRISNVFVSAGQWTKSCHLLYHGLYCSFFQCLYCFSFITIFAQTKMLCRSRRPFPGSSQRRRAAASGADNDDQCPTTRFSNNLDECEICAH